MKAAAFVGFISILLLSLRVEGTRISPAPPVKKDTPRRISNNQADLIPSAESEQSLSNIHLENTILNKSPEYVDHFCCERSEMDECLDGQKEPLCDGELLETELFALDVLKSRFNSVVETDGSSRVNMSPHQGLSNTAERVEMAQPLIVESEDGLRIPRAPRSHRDIRMNKDWGHSIAALPLHSQRFKQPKSYSSHHQNVRIE